MEENAENIRKYLDEIEQNIQTVGIGLDYIDEKLNGAVPNNNATQPERMEPSIFEELAIICDSTAKMKMRISKLTSQF